jgi:hypothetical protein
MPQASPVGTAREPRAFELVINSLQTEVTKAKDNSNDLKEIVSRVSNFTPNCDTEKSEPKPDSPEGILSVINDLLDALKFINRRNTEVLQYLNELV